MNRQNVITDAHRLTKILDILSRIIPDDGPATGPRTRDQIDAILERLYRMADWISENYFSKLEAERRLSDITRTIMTMAAQDFKKPAQVTDKGDIFDAVATGLNMLAEELEDSTVSRSYLDNLVQSMPDMLIVTSLAGRIRTVNNTTLRLLGYKEQELLNTSVEKVITLVKENPQDRERMDINDPLVNVEAVLSGKDGRQIPVSLSRSIMQDDGNLGNQGVIFIAQDMTERKKAELKLNESNERYQSLFNRSLSWVLIHDFKGNLLDANQAALSALGYTKDEISGVHLAQFIDPEQLGDKIKNIEEIIVNGAQQRPQAYRLKTKNGTYLWVELEGALLYKDGIPFAIQGIGRDITEQVRAEALLRERTLELGERIKELDCLTSVLELVTQSEWLEEEVYQAMVSIIPGSWKYPDSACCRLRIDNAAFISQGFKETKWKQAADVVVTGTTRGRLEVFYRDNKPDAGEGPFLKEERNLINALAREIGKYLERKQAERLLKASEERFKLLFEYAPDAYYLNDMKGTLIDGNQAAERLTGYQREELVGKSFLKLGLLPGGQIPKAAKLLARNALGKSTGPDEFGLRQKNGHKVTVEISTFPVKVQGKRLVLGIARDITSRKRIEAVMRESEERFRSIFDHATDGILLADLETKRFRMANQRICQMLGYHSEELTGLGVTDIHPATGLPYVIEQFEKQAKGEIELAQDIPVKRKDGSIFYADVNSNPLELQGKPCLMGIFRDISERKNAEKEREKMITELKASIEKIRTLSGLVPICSACKKIRDDKGYWNQLETYIEEHSSAEFSHGLCPECIKKLYPEEKK